MNRKKLYRPRKLRRRQAPESPTYDPEVLRAMELGWPCKCSVCREAWAEIFSPSDSSWYCRVCSTSITQEQINV